MGVDETIADVPCDHFAADPAAKPLPRTEAATPAEPAAPAPAAAADALPFGRPARMPAVPHVDAYDRAGRATSLAELRAIVAEFEGCALRATATNLVFGDGVAEAAVVFIGEAPGAEEDRQGLPFVGASGRLLDRMLASIGLDRRCVFISNTVFWRPPGNRAPTNWEIGLCQPFVQRIIEIIAPRLLVALGGPAATALFGVSEGVGRLRGRWFSYRTSSLARPIPATALFHPAYLLRSPSQKRLAWRDLLMIKSELAKIENK